MRITYAPRPDAAPEAELDVLASIYRFVLDCGERRRGEETKKGTRPGAPDDAEEPENDRTAEPENRP
jgi:hypothetical protein